LATVTLLVRQSRFLHYNEGGFVSAGEACLIDPGILRDEVEALLRQLAGAEARYVALTYADWDDVLKPEHLPPCTIVAHAAYLDDLDADGTRAMLAQLEAHADVTRERPFEPPLPDVTFETERALRVGELELRLEHAPGRTASMLTLDEPQSRTLWPADVPSDVEIPSVIHDLASYEQTIARIAELEIAKLVPGHGNPTHDKAEIRRRLEEDRRYLDQLRAAVTDAVAAGRSLEATVAACEAIQFRRSDDDATTHRLNVEKVYADLGGDADPAQVGYARPVGKRPTPDRDAETCATLDCLDGPLRGTVPLGRREQLRATFGERPLEPRQASAANGRRLIEGRAVTDRQRLRQGHAGAGGARTLTPPHGGLQAVRRPR
jgi:hydroxyacylglutathione hydrolase